MRVRAILSLAAVMAFAFAVGIATDAVHGSDAVDVDVDVSGSCEPCEVRQGVVVIGSGPAHQTTTVAECCRLCREAGPMKCKYFTFEAPWCSFRLDDTETGAAPNAVSGAWPPGCR